MLHVASVPVPRVPLDRMSPDGERPVLYASVDALSPAVQDALAHERIELRGIGGIAEVRDTGETPAVLLLDDSLLPAGEDLRHALTRVPNAIVIISVGDAGRQLGTLNDRIYLNVPVAAERHTFLGVLRAAFQHSATRIGARRVEDELARSRYELNELSRIGMALMTERDQDRLLVQILEQARRLTQSDAGSLYLVEGGGDTPRMLRFKLAQNESLVNLEFSEFTLPLDPTSVAGYTATLGKPLRLDDAYQLPADAPYTFNRTFDQRLGYRTRSMLVMPMVDHREEVVGVVQLINRKSEVTARITSEEAATKYVLPYGDHELQLVGSLAGQAAISIENSRLYAQIENLFESFVKAAVTAIDQRDPTTAGHSVRVAALTVGMAEVIHRQPTGLYADVYFSREQMRELRYAALLHDFGKVGVREEVLIKAKKLPPYLFERVEARFTLIRRTMEADFYHRRADSLLRGAGDVQSVLVQLDQQFETDRDELDRFHAAVRAANEPAILAEKSAEILEEVARRNYRDASEETSPYLSPEELHFLRIPKGSLDERERLEIESHVEQTYLFLNQIPWTEDLRGLANIAYGHHEKLNGRGYPRGVSGDQIPIQTRVMTIADIFDALTASDRPYKRALPVERALDIIRMEAKEGMLDHGLVELLIESGVYRDVLEKDWREL